MRIVAKVSYETFYAVWRLIAKVAEYVYSLVCVIDRWLADHEK